MCRHICLWVCNVSVRMWVWRPEVNVGFLFQSLSALYFVIMAFTESRTPNLAKLLVCKLQDFFLFYFFSVRIAGAHCGAWLFTWAPGIFFYHVSNYKAINVTDLCKFTLAYLSTFFWLQVGWGFFSMKGRPPSSVRGKLHICWDHICLYPKRSCVNWQALIHPKTFWVYHCLLLLTRG